MRRFNTILALPLLSVALLPAPLAAQEGESVEARPVLTPSTSDMGLGFNAVPFLNFLGNSFNDSGYYNSVSSQFVDGSQTIYAKYVLGPQQIIRARVRPTLIGYTESHAVSDDNVEDYDPTATVVDTMDYSAFGLDLGAGLELRRGGRRLQGLYGVEGRLMMNRQKAVYTYGNDMTDDNPSPTTWQFDYGYPDDTLQRTLAYKSGMTFGLGARAFAGVEFFLAPQISLGAEFGWGPMIMKTGEGTQDIEWWDLEDDEKEDGTATLPGSGSFVLDTDNMDGAITLMFYF